MAGEKTLKNFSFVFLEPGQKVLIVHRRLFERDRPRFFLGVVDGFNENNGLLKVTGHSIGPAKTGGLAKRKVSATKILSLTSGTLLVYQLDISVDLEKTTVSVDHDGNVRLQEGSNELMDLSEMIS